MRTLLLLMSCCCLAITLSAQKDQDLAREGLNCIDYVSGSSLAITEVGTPSISDEIFIPDDFAISTITIHLDLTHTQIGDLDARLIAPTETNVLLFDRPGFPNNDFGCSGANLLLSFNANSSNAASSLESSCNTSETGANIAGPPHTISGEYRAIGNLAGLNNQSSQGAWQLVVNDNEVADGGILEAWRITVCYELEGSPPELITNMTLPVTYGQESLLTNDNLRVVDNDNSPNELTYRLNTSPSEGSLRRNGQMLGVEDTFTQQDIDNGLMSYTHQGGNILSDAFNFDLTDAAGFCLENNVFQIEIISTNFIASLTQTSVIFCNGGNDGMIETSVQGGIPPYTYRLNGGPFQESNIFDNLSAGSYSVIVVDQIGTIAGTNTVVISQPDVLMANLTVEEDMITVNTSGGTPGYTYFLNSSVVQNDNVFIGLANGSYSVTVVDANGCLTTTAAVEVSVNTLGLNAVLSKGITCFNQSDATVAITATGGTPPLMYRMNNGSLQSNPVFENLSAGTYIPQVVDSEGFMRQTTAITITNPAPLAAIADIFQNSITIQAEGGTPPLRYQLNNGTPQDSNIFENVANGFYAIRTIDANGCEIILSATIAFNTLAISAMLVEELDCSNDEDGVITLAVTGGTLPLQYRLSDGSWQASPAFENLAAGTYVPEVLDSEGFTRQTTPIVINNPPALTASAEVLQDNIIVNAQGGTPPLRYQLSNSEPQENNVFNDLNNGTYAVHVIDANDCELVLLTTVAVNTLSIGATLTQDLACFDDETGVITLTVNGGTPPFLYQLNNGDLQNNPVFTNLPAGTYLPQVIDSEGFTRTGTTVSIQNPEALTANLNVEENSITVLAAGGTPPLQYQLNDGELQAVNNFSNLANGYYTISIVDANGCSVVLNASILINDMEVVVELLAGVSCYGEEDAAIGGNVTGGTPPFLYQLNNGPFLSLPDFYTLGAGTYNITVLDANGFLQPSNTIVVTEPDLLIMEATLAGADLIINASGGTPPYDYRIDNENWLTSPFFPDLSDDVYTVRVRDNNGCTSMQNVTVAVTSLVAAFQLVDDVSCFGGRDAGFAVLMNGGLAPYLYSLNGMSFQESNAFDSLGAGTYEVSVQDQFGAMLDTFYTINEPDLLDLSLSVAEQSISALTAGGTAPFSYQLNGGISQEEPIFTDLLLGEYEVTVTDANGCVDTQMASVLVAVAELSEQEWKLSLCPNPNHGQFQLSIPETLQRNLQLYVYNTAGQLVWQQLKNEQSVAGNIDFDLSIYPAGVYQMVITHGQKVGRIRFVMN
ncbi:MAG: cadherin-like domain-containing protein [Bacteroidota bacterium]